LKNDKFPQQIVNEEEKEEEASAKVHQVYLFVRKARWNCESRKSLT